MSLVDTYPCTSNAKLIINIIINHTFARKLCPSVFLSLSSKTQGFPLLYAGHTSQLSMISFKIFQTIWQYEKFVIVISWDLLAWINNNIYIKQWDVISHTLISTAVYLNRRSLKWRGGVFTFHIRPLIWLLIGALRPPGDGMRVSFTLLMTLSTASLTLINK